MAPPAPTSQKLVISLTVLSEANLTTNLLFLTRSPFQTVSKTNWIIFLKAQKRRKVKLLGRRWEGGTYCRNDTHVVQNTKPQFGISHEIKYFDVNPSVYFYDVAQCQLEQRHKLWTILVI